MRKVNSSGFSLVAGLLIVLIVAVLGFAGYYVYNEQTKKNDNKTKTEQSNQNTSTNNSTSATTNPTSSTKYLEIKELGVKIPLSEKLTNTTYVTTDVPADYAKIYSFSTPSLSSKIAVCILSETKSQPYVYREVFRGIGNKFEPNKQAGETAFSLKQFDNFYVAAIGQPTPSPCTNKDGTSQDNTEIVNDIRNYQNELDTAFQNSEKL